MTEADLLELASEARANIAFIVTQIIAVHFALLAGIYYFLNAGPRALKLATLAIYTFGYGSLLGLYFWETETLAGVYAALAALPEPTDGAGAVLGWDNWIGDFQMAAAITMFAVGWLIIAVALFTPIPRTRRTDRRG